MDAKQLEFVLINYPTSLMNFFVVDFFQRVNGGIFSRGLFISDSDDKQNDSQ